MESKNKTKQVEEQSGNDPFKKSGKVVRSPPTANKAAVSMEKNTPVAVPIAMERNTPVAAKTSTKASGADTVTNVMPQPKMRPTSVLSLNGTPFGEGLAAMRLILKEMEAAVKKQPNISRAIKDSLPKLEENLDRLQFLANSWPKTQKLDDASSADFQIKEGGKRSAASPPTMDVAKSAKKVKPDQRLSPKTSGKNTPTKVIAPIEAISSKMTDTPTGGWSNVARQKGSQSQKKSISESSAPSKEKKKSKKRRKKRGGAKKRSRPDAILLKPAEGKSYADVLSAVRTKVNPESCGVEVKSIRKTKVGEVLVELKKSTTQNRNAFQLKLKEAAGDLSNVRELVPQEKLEIRDIDDCTSADEVRSALQNILGDYKGVIEISMTKPNWSGQRMAVVNIEATAAKVLLQRGKVKLGWVSCRIRGRVDVPRCFKCLGYGHRGSICKGPDRANLCFQCGAEGHRARDCKSQPMCYLCSDKEANGRKHVAGSGACGVFRKALEKVKCGK